jgi:hypothetical protein
MQKPDLPALLAVADIVHPAYPEDPAVFAERLNLYPEGCLVLEQGGKAMGYAVSHPGAYGAPPALNSLLGALPDKPTTYYFHGGGAARGTCRTTGIPRNHANSGQ